MYIVFDREDAARLKESFELDPTLSSEVFVIAGDYSIGPLKDSDEGSGLKRNEWLAEVNLQQEKEGNRDEEFLNEYLLQHPEEKLLIWISPNSRDVCGYYFLVYNLRDFGRRLETIWLNNLPFINEKGQVFYPEYLKQIPSKEFLKARKLAQPVSAATCETDPDEWAKMLEENKMLRVLEGAKKLMGKEETFFDAQVLSRVNTEWQKSGKVTQNLLSQSKFTVSENFLLWRMRVMIRTNLLEGQGDWVANDRFEVRKPNAEVQS